jgi:hypothetical protein
MRDEIDELVDEALLRGQGFSEPHFFQCVDNSGRVRYSSQTYEMEEVMEAFEAACAALAERTEGEDLL